MHHGAVVLVPRPRCGIPWEGLCVWMPTSPPTFFIVRLRSERLTSGHVNMSDLALDGLVMGESGSHGADG